VLSIPALYHIIVPNARAYSASRGKEFEENGFGVSRDYYAEDKAPRETIAGGTVKRKARSLLREVFYCPGQGHILDSHARKEEALFNNSFGKTLRGPVEGCLCSR